MCLECARVNDPKGWMSTRCHECGMPVYFQKMEDRDYYAQTGPFAPHLIEKKGQAKSATYKSS